MKVAVEKTQKLVALAEVPVGACVRLALWANDDIYMHIDNHITTGYSWVRLNDGALFHATTLPGYQWELVEAEVVIK